MHEAIRILQGFHAYISKIERGVIPANCAQETLRDMAGTVMAYERNSYLRNEYAKLMGQAIALLVRANLRIPDISRYVAA